MMLIQQLGFRNRPQRIGLLACIGLLALVASACSSLPIGKPESPTVSVVSVRPLSLSLTRQTLAFKLRVHNPNGFDLPMESLSFNARFADESIAEGFSDQKVTIPAGDDALIDVTVKTGLGALMTQFKSMLSKQELKLNYELEGVVKLSNWPRAIPFKVDGELQEPATQ